MNWKFENGRLSCAAKNAPFFSMNNVGGSVELDGTLIPAENCADYGIKWIWDVRQTDNGIAVKATLKNESSSMIRIGIWNLLHGKTNSLALNNKPEDALFFQLDTLGNFNRKFCRR